MFLVLFLCHWSLIGLSKTYFFQIPEDFLLASATIPGLYLFFREYFLNNLHADTKPKAKYINWLLITVCIGLAILLTTTMFLELVPKNLSETERIVFSRNKKSLFITIKVIEGDFHIPAY